MKKKATWVILIILVVVVVACLIALSMFADVALKAGIEAAATKKLNVQVDVGSLDLSLLNGRIGLKDLAVANPPGYEHPKLLELGDAVIKTDMGTLLSDTVQIERINLDQVTLVLEQKNLTTSNLSEILDTIKGDQKDGGSAGAGETVDGKKLHITELTVSNITVKAKLLPIPGKLDTVTLKISPIELKDLGGDKPIDTAALVGVVIAAVAKGVYEQAGDKLPLDMLGKPGELLKQIQQIQQIKALPGKVLEQGTGAVEKADDVRKGVTEGIEGIKGIFQKKE